MPTNRLHYPPCLLLAVLLWLLRCCCGRLSIDFSELRSPESIRLAQLYQAASFFDVHSSATFRLKMNADAMQKFGLNKTSFLDAPKHMETPLGRLSVAEAAIDAVSQGLLPEGEDLLRSMLTGPLQTSVVTLRPTDEQLDELFIFLEAYKSFWKIIGRETVPQIEDISNDATKRNILDVLQLLEKITPSNEGNRTPRKFDPMKVSKTTLNHLITTVFNVPRNVVEHSKNMTTVREFVRRRFEDFGLLVTEHVFATYDADYLYGERVEGTNLVGVLTGTRWGSIEDRPVVVGAHMDTVDGSPGMDDNGSGMSALLEIARMLTSSTCKFHNTIIFVAFDLEERGTQGSMMFIKDFAGRVLQQHVGASRITGAIVLDCVANWDPQPGSQDIPESWRAYMPEFIARMESGNHTGDFISLIYRNGIDSFLANKFSSYYSRLSNPQYRLELLGVDGLGPTRPSPEMFQKYFDVMRSDHSRFWYHADDNDGSLNQTIPAVLVTDTGPYRGRLRDCYHRPCDTYTDGKPLDLGLLAKTTEAVAWTAADLAGGRCGPRSRLTVRQLFGLLTFFRSKGLAAKTIVNNVTTGKYSILDGAPQSTMLNNTSAMNIDNVKLAAIKTKENNFSKIKKRVL